MKKMLMIVYQFIKKKLKKLKEIEKYYYEQVRDIFQLIEKI